MGLLLSVDDLGYLEPWRVFFNFANIPYSCLLESTYFHPEFGRFSFIGVFPYLVVIQKNKTELILIEPEEQKEEIKSTNIFCEIRDILSRNKVLVYSNDLPGFIGGGIGYFGYDLCELLEDELRLKSKDDLYLPLAVFAFYDTIIAFDHLLKKTYILSIINNRDNNIKDTININRDTKKIQKKIYNLLSKKIDSGENLPPFVINSNINSNFTKEDYIDAVEKALEYIHAGDIYQINLSQRFSINDIEIKNPFMLYLRLRQKNPGYFASYLNLKDFIIISSSPERFLYVKERRVQTRPIKGTIKRTNLGAAQNLINKQILINSQKDKAELLMIVDLLRNDLGKVCEYNSIYVKSLREIETFKTVFHTVATIEGKLREDKDLMDLIMAAFPGGSITGCPKIRSIEIIDELENLRRGVYTGSLGYISFNGVMDMNIIIRSFIFVVEKRTLCFNVGGGIVSDSSPQAEYYETLYKAEGLFNSLMAPSFSLSYLF